MYRKLIGRICNKSLTLKKSYLEKIFKERLGYELDFNKAPETYNQKIQFRKVFDNNPLYSICSDKYLAREYVEKKIGGEYLIPLYFVGDELTEDDYDKLPNECVIKANHNSGPVKVVFDKSRENKKKIIKEFERQLKEKYGILSMETYYDDIPTKVIAEKLLKDEKGNVPSDYKLHCFKNNGDFKIFIQVDQSRFQNHTREIYSQDWERLNLEIQYKSGRNIERPKNFEKMKELAKKLAEDFEYVRVDFYNLEGQIYFGELTFCHGSGFEKFDPRVADYEWGSYWK